PRQSDRRLGVAAERAARFARRARGTLRPGGGALRRRAGAAAAVLGRLLVGARTHRAVERPRAPLARSLALSARGRGLEHGAAVSVSAPRRAATAMGTAAVRGAASVPRRPG